MLATDRIVTQRMQTRYIASLIATVILACIVFHFRSQSEASPEAVMFLHFVSFAGHFGAQCWVTFVAGLTMFYNLPRFYFGQVQARLFPLYFFSTFILSCVTFITYYIHKPYNSWTHADLKQVAMLLCCVLSTCLNAFVLSPGLVTTMTAVFDLEKEYGTAFIIGHVDRSELTKRPEYKLCYRKFRQYHAMSAMANILTLVCNIVYLYHLACLCVHLSITSCEAGITCR